MAESGLPASSIYMPASPQEIDYPKASLTIVLVEGAAGILRGSGCPWFPEAWASDLMTRWLQLGPFVVFQ